jgi:hypothetical protein
MVVLSVETAMSRSAAASAKLPERQAAQVDHRIRQFDAA